MGRGGRTPYTAQSAVYGQRGEAALTQHFSEKNAARAPDPWEFCRSAPIKGDVHYPRSAALIGE